MSVLASMAGCGLMCAPRAVEYVRNGESNDRPPEKPSEEARGKGTVQAQGPGSGYSCKPAEPQATGTREAPRTGTPVRLQRVREELRLLDP